MLKHGKASKSSHFRFSGRGRLQAAGEMAPSRPGPGSGRGRDDVCWLPGTRPGLPLARYSRGRRRLHRRTYYTYSAAAPTYQPPNRTRPFSPSAAPPPAMCVVSPCRARAFTDGGPSPARARTSSSVRLISDESVSRFRHAQVKTGEKLRARQLRIYTNYNLLHVKQCHRRRSRVRATRAVGDLSAINADIDGYVVQYVHIHAYFF